jgi:hypothetical protein
VGSVSGRSGTVAFAAERVGVRSSACGNLMRRHGA